MAYTQSMMGNIPSSTQDIRSFSLDTTTNMLENRIRDLEAMITNAAHSSAWSSPSYSTQGWNSWNAPSWNAMSWNSPSMMENMRMHNSSHTPMWSSWNSPSAIENMRMFSHNPMWASNPSTWAPHAHNAHSWHPHTWAHPFAHSHIAHIWDAMRHQSSFPRTDVIETKDNYQFQLEIPGFTPENISVTMENNTLTVRGYRSAASCEAPAKAGKESKESKQQRSEDMNILCNERSSRGFIRQFTFPEMVSEKGIEATIRHGLLTIVVNKGASKNASNINVRQAN